MLINKTDYHGGGNSEFFETHLDHVQGEYQLRQAHNGGGPLSHDVETVWMNRQQAIDIAKTILRNEGYSIAKD
ncbi:hypothetical protein [Pectobacterium phage PPWS1]|uniref:Uncharacterized protein n=1 Tax=Pectobacterium phage PPWS1 TaxID=1685500 RepID=A0A0P0UW14_9CAUD|nr:hypothetical protein HOR09_gp27 [Pectobacterium phage PPWS1]BAS69542.1 hypothetical protein [Pectobacterium phage PPWS1]